MILILGSKGMLGSALLSVFGNGCVGWDREDCDVTDSADLRLKILNLKPSVIINCVAYNDVDGAEQNHDVAFKLNAELPGELASICQELNIPLVHFSTNYIFDGGAGEYKEDSLPTPISAYAQSKAQGEKLLVDNYQQTYLIRTSVLFGTPGQSQATKKSFVALMLDLSQKTDTIKAVNDEVNSLTYVKDLALAVKQLLDNKSPFGIYHITNSGQASWYDFAKEIFSITVKKINLTPVPSSDFPRAAQRPKKSVLINTKLPALRPWQEALKEFLG